MIHKLEGTKNGYVIDDTSTAEGFEDLEEICKQYEKTTCIICNAKTKQERFRVRLLGRDIITVNNKVPDDVFFLNGRY